MKFCDSSAQSHTPALTESIKELTKELRECRRAYQENVSNQTNRDQENDPPQDADPVRRDRQQVKREPTTFAEANELTSDDRYEEIISTCGAQPEMAAPLSVLKPSDSNIHKNKPKSRDLSAARMSTGGRKQRGKKDLATKYNALKKAQKSSNLFQGNPAVNPDPVCENAPLSLGIEGFSSASEVIEAAERIRRRCNPDYRTVEDAREERKTEKHSGCATCRLHAYEAAEGRRDGQKIYDEIVGACTHVPLGNNRCNEDVPKKESEEEELGPVW